ncbi:MAG: glycosyltransferase family 4 protein, partial [Cyanobacteriota bacterium]
QQHPSSATGLFFDSQTPAALIQAVESFEACQRQFSPENCQLQAANFSPVIFKQRYLDTLDRCFQAFQTQIGTEKNDWFGSD